MPILVKLRVKRGSSLPVNERAKKQRTADVLSEIATTAEKVTVKTEEIDGSTPACDHGVSHSASTSCTSFTASSQVTAQVGNSDNAEICAFEGSLKGDLVDSLSNQDNKSLPINNGFSELENEEVAQNSTAQKQAAIPFLLKNKKKRKYPSWDERFEELVDFKAINRHTNVPFGSGPLGTWVHTQRTQYRLLKEGKHSTLTNDKREKMEGIRFEFGRPWDQRFEELVGFKKINGHVSVPQGSGPLGRWVSEQRRQYCRLNKGKRSLLTNDKREKLESIGFTFICRPSPTVTHWDQRFQELVDFKKINGHTNVPDGSGSLGKWVSYHRTQYRLLNEGKHSTFSSDKCEKLESIGFTFVHRPGPTITPWDQRFEELVDFKKINGHTNVPQGSGPLGRWVSEQRRQYCRLNEGKRAGLSNDKRERLESIGFTFIRRPTPTITYWDQRFQELVDFKKINGHTIVPRGSGSFGTWVHTQRTRYCRLKEGRSSTLSNDKREKLESIGFTFIRHPSPTIITHWDQRFQALVDFHNINGHSNVPDGSGPLGQWVSYQRTQYYLLEEGKHSTLTNENREKREKLESIGFVFVCPPSGPPCDQQFEELVDLKKINGQDPDH
eukprot:scaffold53821_cov50-Attheya_sp.AAC.2